MKLLITTLICFFAAFQSSNAQVVKSEWDNTSWTDGITEYKAKVLNSSQVLMIGSGYFDAGYGSVFQIQKVKDNEWRMSVLPNNNVVLPANYADFLVLNELLMEFRALDELLTEMMLLSAWIMERQQMPSLRLNLANRWLTLLKHK